jgi:hypothetical protein
VPGTLTLSPDEFFLMQDFQREEKRREEKKEKPKKKRQSALHFLLFS